MGASNAYRTYETTDKAEIRKRFAAADLEQARYENGAGPYSGSLGQKTGIGVWRDRPTNFDDAHEWILGQSGKWDNNAAAAAYYLTEALTARDTARIKKAETKATTANTKLREIEQAVFAALRNAKSKTVGCRGCGSKIARKHLKGTVCPVCTSNTLLSASAHSRVMAARKRVDKAREALAEARKPKPGKKVAYVVGGWVGE